MLGSARDPRVLASPHVCKRTVVALTLYTIPPIPSAGGLSFGFLKMWPNVLTGLKAVRIRNF